MGRIGDEIRLMNPGKNRTATGTRDPAFQNILYAGWTTMQCGMKIQPDDIRDLSNVAEDQVFKKYFIFSRFTKKRQNCHSIAWHDYIRSFVILMWQGFTPPGPFRVLHCTSASPDLIMS
jgi:hypothetical protein